MVAIWVGWTIQASQGMKIGKWGEHKSKKEIMKGTNGSDLRVDP